MEPHPFRIGGGPQTGLMFIPRQSGTGGMLWGFTLGITTHARVELYMWGDNAFFLEARSSLTFPMMITAETYVGFRL